MQGILKRMPCLFGTLTTRYRFRAEKAIRNMDEINVEIEA
jgi:hypothetical protein